MTDITQWTSVAPLITEMPTWLPEEEQERIGAYTTYENLYWSNPDTFKLVYRGDNDNPIYIPNPRTIVDSTSHYLLKNLKVGFTTQPDEPDEGGIFENFLKREKFYSTFQVAKHSGVARGDFILHVTADPSKPELRRISISSIDPARYFPIYDPDDVDKLVAVSLVDQVWYPEDQKARVHELTYRYRMVSGLQRVTVEENIWELDNWWLPDKRTRFKLIQKEALLPSEFITTIPVYHFKNIDWQGQPFGSSELRGYERIMGAVNQTMSDEDISLALQGLGVYATDSGRPVNDDGQEEDWVIAPAKVMEVPGGSYFRRVEGVSSVTPMIDHVKYLTDSLMKSSATFDASAVEVAVAESGVALAIRFMPTLAKVEERDEEGLGVLTQMFFDLRTGWWPYYEPQSALPESEIEVTLGRKLPQSNKEILNELNNMYDRKLISSKYYRDKMEELGYVFPKNIEAEIEADIKKTQERAASAQSERSPDQGGAPNTSRPNESGGTEAGD